MDFFASLQQMGPAIENVEHTTTSINENLERIAVALEGIRNLTADYINYHNQADFHNSLENHCEAHAFDDNHDG